MDMLLILGALVAIGLIVHVTRRAPLSEGERALRRSGAAKRGASRKRGISHEWVEGQKVTTGDILLREDGRWSAKFTDEGQIVVKDLTRRQIARTYTILAGEPMEGNYTGIINEAGCFVVTGQTTSKFGGKTLQGSTCFQGGEVFGGRGPWKMYLDYDGNLVTNR